MVCILCINFFPRPAPQLWPGLRSHCSCSIRMTKLQTSLGHALGLNGHLDAVPAIAKDPADVPYWPGWWPVVRADGHFNSLGDGLRFPYNKSTGSRLCWVSHGILKGIKWCAVALHGFGMFRGPGPVIWFTAVIHQLKHVWLHPCHPRSKNVVPQTLGIFTNLLGFPLPKWFREDFVKILQIFASY